MSRIRRCAVLFLEPRESVDFDIASLFQGESGLRSEITWVALAPHLESEVGVDAAERELLGNVGETQWLERDTLVAAHGANVIDSLLGKGLLISDDVRHREQRQRDEQVRSTFWKPLSAIAHFFSRWSDVDAGAASRETGLQSTADLVDRFGAAPPHFHARSDNLKRQLLSRPLPDKFGQLLQRRTTCRNFDQQRAVDAQRFSRVLHTVFAAQAAVELAPDTSALKKTSPSGGGLHATSAYLLIQHVEGIDPGLYHYHCGDHALELLHRAEALSPLASTPTDNVANASVDQEPTSPRARLQALANRCVAGQDWFADAQVLVVLVPRFKRSFWKYRNHAKAYRALILDAGHLSQTLYLTATELGLGAVITAAVNEIEIERAFGLDPLDESPIAICGFGWRAEQKLTVEFDPLRQVWDKPGPD
jgi:putative peptide maturation dehydrogenase